MVVAKVIRLRRTKKSKVSSELDGSAVIPESMLVIQRQLDRVIDKAYPCLIYLANRNADGVTPKEWYEYVCEGLGIEPREEDYVRTSSSGLPERNDSMLPDQS